MERKIKSPARAERKKNVGLIRPLTSPQQHLMTEEGGEMFPESCKQEKKIEPKILCPAHLFYVYGNGKAFSILYVFWEQ